MLNIVIPMAGSGSRFAAVGYTQPKPLILVNGVPMIQVVINNLRPSCVHRFIFICQRSHVAEYGLRERLGFWAPGSRIIEIDGLTEGAACTVLAARSLIDSDEPLMIANTDQYLEVDMRQYLKVLELHGLDGLIMTMTAKDPKWSFVGFDDQGRVNRVVEKQVISSEATVGIYNFRRGRDFVAAADAMIATQERVNGEFYVAPVYNSMINSGQHIGVFNIGSEGLGMYGLGTPSDLELFLANPVSQHII
jgi:dTDP-glucose pyrophosphorylase